MSDSIALPVWCCLHACGVAYMHAGLFTCMLCCLHVHGVVCKHAGVIYMPDLFITCLHCTVYYTYI